MIAGQHGNEPSGVAAARALSRGPRPRHGRLKIISVANPEALTLGQRATEAGDLNRAYPDGNPRASALFAQALEADLVLDLHESGTAWQEADVPTLVLSPAAAPFALDLLQRLNRRRPSFAYTGGAPAGSLVGELGNAGRTALVVEIPARLPLRQRLALHRRVVEASLDQLGLR